jgi:hypothetical protein
MVPLEHLEKAFRKVINTPQMTRYKARQVLKSLLLTHGWVFIEDSELGDIVAYLRTSGVFVVIKLWIHPEHKDVPKFYVENFLRSIFKTSENCKTTPMFDQRTCTECERFCLLSKKVYKYFVSNAPLDPEAYAYFRGHSKGTKLIVAPVNKNEKRNAGIDWSKDRVGTLDFFTQLSTKHSPTADSV